MKKQRASQPDPFVLEAAVTDGVFDLVLTQRGYEVMETALAELRETDPRATYEDVLAEMLRDLIDELEAEMN